MSSEDPTLCHAAAFSQVIPDSGHSAILVTRPDWTDNFPEVGTDCANGRSENDDRSDRP